MPDAQDQGLPPPLVGINGGPVTRGNPPAAYVFPPGKSGNPGGRKRGASILHEIERRLAKGAQFDESGELVKAGDEACAIAGALIEVAVGSKDPAGVDVKAALALMDRVDGPIVKESRTESTHVVQGIELIDRRPSPKDLPGTASK